MKELKKHTSVHKQVEILQSRGIVIEEPLKAEEWLKNNSYYRLTGYLHDFKKPGSSDYQNLNWNHLKKIYDFDRKLTKLLLFALEDIEETLKTKLSYTITSLYPEDPLIYLKPYIYNEYYPYLIFLSEFYSKKDSSVKIPFVKHHYNYYDGMLPFWVAVELFTMGNLEAVYSNLKSRIKKNISVQYGLSPVELANWVEHLRRLRNHLAHYMRIYNYNFGRTPLNSKKHPRTFEKSNMVFDQVFIISRLYSDPHEWNNYVLNELSVLLDKYDDAIELSSLGFPENWEDILTIK